MALPSESPHQSAGSLPGCSTRTIAQGNSVQVCVLTVSDSRDITTDRGGAIICNLLESNQHHVAERKIVPDDMDTIRLAVQDWVSRSQSAILVTGGTGLGVRDITPEAIEPLYTRLLPGYGELFRMLSYEQVGAAAMLSRASGGVIENTVVLTMPGSPKAVDLAMQKLILPELGHLVSHASEPKKSDPS